MSVISHTWALAVQAAGLLVTWWPGTLSVVVAVGVATRLEGPPRDQELRSLPAVLCLFPALMLIWGGLAHHNVPVSDAGLWRTLVLGAILLGQLLATIAVVYVSRDHRWYVATIAFAISWFGGICAYLSWLSVTGLLPAGSAAS